MSVCVREWNQFTSRKKLFGPEADNEICQENCSWIYLFSTDQIDGDTTVLALETPRISVENEYEIVDTNV